MCFASAIILPRSALYGPVLSYPILCHPIVTHHILFIVPAGSYTDYLEYRRDDAQFKKEEAALAKRELVAASNAASSNSKSAKKVEAKVVETTAVTSSPAPPSSPAAAVAAPGSKLNYNERKEFNKLEKEIEKLGVQIGDFEDKLAAASSAGQGYSALAELTEKMNALIMSRELKEQRWMELADDDA